MNWNEFKLHQQEKTTRMKEAAKGPTRVKERKESIRERQANVMPLSKKTRLMEFLRGLVI